MQPEDDLSNVDERLTPQFQEQVERLHRLTVYARWSLAALLWVIVGPLSLWGLRYPISLMLDYFTWASVYYGLHFHPIPAFGLFFCFAFTTAVLIWQSRNIIFGLPKGERKKLERQVLRIRQKGASHPLWKYVCKAHSEQVNESH